MKYSKTNPPLTCMMTQSTCYKGTKTMKVLGVLWHSTGANNPNLRRYVQPDDKAADRAALLQKLGTNSNRNDWNHVTVQAGLNAWVGKLADGTVAAVQTMPWDYRPWGCGSGKKGSCNSGWIQFEICEDGLTDRTYFEAAYKEAVELTAYLCQLYGIDPKGTATLNGVKVPTILCHADSHTLGLGSNHGDVLHWFPRFGKSMDTVRTDVAALLPGSTAPAPAPTPTPAPSTPEKAVNYTVKVTVKDLHIRSGPGTGYANKGFIAPGVYTITAEATGTGATLWGKLKSGAGWISLDYATRTGTTAPAVKAVTEGSTVTIKPGAVYGGLASSRGAQVPSYITGARRYTVKQIATHKGDQEALLAEINSWVALSYLVLV